MGWCQCFVTSGAMLTWVFSFGLQVTKIPGIFFLKKRTRTYNCSAFWPKRLLEFFEQCQSNACFTANNFGLGNFVAKQVRRFALHGVQEKVTHTKTCQALFRWPCSIWELSWGSRNIYPYPPALLVLSQQEVLFSPSPKQPICKVRRLRSAEQLLLICR